MLNNFTTTSAPRMSLILLPLTNFHSPPTPNGPYLTVFSTKMIEYMFWMLPTCAGEFSRTSMTTRLRGTSARTRLWNSFVGSMYGLNFVKDYCNTCTICKRSKAPRHKPYGLLKQLPIPTRPWDSISMDFIEHLLPSARYTAILVIVERLTKQSIFIPTYDTITSAQLTELFVLYVFSKHSVPGHVMSDWGSEFVLYFF